MWRLSPEGPISRKHISFHADETRTVFRGGSVIDGTGRDRYRADVVVVGERITFVGEAGPSACEGARLIDCDGMTVMPGLIDVHIHFGGEITSEQFKRYLWPDDRVRTILAAFTAFAAFDAGFTTVRDLGLTGAGYALRYAINSGMLAGPRILTAGPSVSPTGGHGDWHAIPLDLVRERRPRSIIADGVDEVRRAVREIHREGADLLKIYLTSGIMTNNQDWPPLPCFTQEEVKVMVEEARTRGWRVSAHVMGVDGIRTAIEGGVDDIQHGFALEGEDPDEILDLMKERNVILTPTLSVYHYVSTVGREWNTIEDGIRRADSFLRRAPDIIGAARRRGIPISLGTDISSRSGVGENGREAKLLEDAGLSRMEAIQAGTKIAAQTLGLERELGTLEAGKLSDVVVLDADPLDDLNVLIGPSHFVTVGKAGSTISQRWYP